MSQLDAAAITAVRDMALASHLTEDLTSTDFRAVVLPEGYEVRDLENLHHHRNRFRGRMGTTSIADFVRYSINLSTDEKPGVSCFINADKMSAVTVFNFGTILMPGHADNTATIMLKQTAPFRALLAIDGKKNRQKELAEWLEDWRDYLLAFDAEGNSMDIKKAVGAVRRITIEAISSSEHEDQDFSGKRSIMESVEAKSKDVMPAAFEFKCTPYDGLTERRFKLRYSIITSDVPQLVLRIVQLETAEEEMAAEFRDLLATEFDGKGIETYIGSFSA